MIKIISLVISCICISISTLKSQSFGDIGTTWYYTQYHFLDAGVDYVKIESIGDTTVNGQLCHHLKRQGYDCSTMDSDIYLYEESNIVYYFLPGLNQFSILYNFNLQAGDTLKGYVFSSTIDSFRMKITAVELDTINEIPLKKFMVENLSIFSFSTTSTDAIIEGIGSTCYLLPQFGACDAHTGPLRCFQNDTLGLYSTNIAPSCDYISTGVPEINSYPNIRITSNPFHDQLKISFPKAIEKISLIISDITGREIFRMEDLISDCAIQTSAWPNGIYLLKVNNANEWYEFEVIKQ